jgi:hypothetical protein
LDVYKLPIGLSLGIIVGILTVAVLASLRRPTAPVSPAEPAAP